MLPQNSSWKDAAASALLFHKQLTAQNFRNTPGLCHATSRSERSLCIEYFTDRPHSIFIEVFLKAAQERLKRSDIVRISAMPCVAEGANQPSPDGSLMVGCIPCPEIAIVLCFVSFVMGR